MRKILIALASFAMLIALSGPAQAVPNSIIRHCDTIYNSAGTRHAKICEEILQATPVPPETQVWARVSIIDANGADGAYKFCCTVTLWEANTGSSNFDVATASTVLWNHGDGDVDYNTNHVDWTGGGLKCKLHTEAGGLNTGELQVTWQQGNTPHDISTQSPTPWDFVGTIPNTNDINLSNYGDHACP
jgi:hypothetical protein